MTAHLLALTVGPVQEFIAAARRTRDLWFGSYLLSEISKAAAKALSDHVGINELIFPAPNSGADLKPDSPLNVANVILAELGDADPAAVAREAKEAARRRWRDFADQVFNRYKSVIQTDIWNGQVDDVIEFYAAWHPYSETTYKDDRAALMRLLAARKLCRDFAPAQGRAGVPKSSLDGLRESILIQPHRGESRADFRDRWPASIRRDLRVGANEELDFVGIVKRTWPRVGGAPRYPSVARVAADPWLRRIPPRNLDALQKACSDLGGEIIHEIDISNERGHPHYAAFPFEGTTAFRSRHRDICEEAGFSDADLKPLANALADLTREYGEPSPYLAVLVADGDRMGAALSALKSPEEHRQFSQALAGFAGEARRIVQGRHGVLVYAGGDDVLAFVPVDRCLDCARKLHDSFGTALESWSEKVATKLTLSVGLAVAHFMEPLEDLLDYGRAAEKHAKRPRPEDGEQTERNGLAVHVVKRGGGPLAIRANWSDGSKGLDKRLRQLAEQLDMRSIPTGLAYDLHAIARSYEHWTAAGVDQAILGDTISMLGGKQPGGASAIATMKTLVRERVTDAGSLRSFANELLVAKTIGTSFDPGGGTGSP